MVLVWAYRLVFVMLKRDLIIIIGAGSGLGKNCADHFSKYYNIVGTIYSSKVLKKKNYKLFKVNINKREDIYKFISKIEKNIKSAKSVNFINFANFQRSNFIYKITKKDLEDTFKVNIFSNIYFCSKIIPLILNKKSSITFVSSSFGIKGDKGIALYSSTKHSLVGLMKSIVSEYSEFDVRCNILSLGFFDSPLWRKLDKKLQNQRLKRVPNNSMGDLKDLFNSIEFIIKTNYFNGSILNLDGGYGSY